MGFHTCWTLVTVFSLIVAVIAVNDNFDGSLYCQCNLKESSGSDPHGCGIRIDKQCFELVLNGSKPVSLSLSGRLNSGTVPTQIGLLSSLERLDLSSNGIELLPVWLFRNLSSLKYLYLRNNVITSLPRQLGELTLLEFLDLSSNSIESVPTLIGKLTSLKKLFLNNNIALRNIPSQIGFLDSLETLDLFGNSIHRLPSEIGFLSRLSYFDISRNPDLTSLPSEVGLLSNLKTIKLAGNEVTDIPTTIGKLLKLEKFEVNDNNISEIPSHLGDILNLRRIEASDNLLEALPPQLGRLNKVAIINVANNQLKSIPPQLGSMTGLQRVLLNDNLLSELPSEIRNWRLLTDLSLNGNKLNRLPTDFGGNFGCLRFLDLSKNELTRLPESLHHQKALTFLSVKNNDLKQIPTAIGELESLVSIDLSVNRIPSLPSEIGKLASLRNLRAGENMISHIPTELYTLKFLAELDLSRNVITGTLSRDLMKLSSLSTLKLGDNKLRMVCDCSLLEWFPHYVTKLRENGDSDLTGKRSIDVLNINVCSNDNEYAGIYPHLLNVDNTAPCSHAVVNKNSIQTTSKRISIGWKYPYLLQEKFSLQRNYYERYLNGNQPFSGDPFEWAIKLGYPFPSDEIIESFFNVSTEELNTYYDVVSRLDSDSLEAFRNCTEFPSVYPDGHAFGFEIKWGQSRKCMWAAELESESCDDNSSFCFNITKLLPMQTYLVSIRTFRVYFGISRPKGPFKSFSEILYPGFVVDPALYVFGPRSIVLNITTDSDAPLLPPRNFVFDAVADRQISMAWDKINLENAQGDINGYEIKIRLASNKRLIEARNSSIRSVFFDKLKPRTQYLISVRAKTRKTASSKDRVDIEDSQWGPWSENLTVVTCPENMKEISSERSQILTLQDINKTYLTRECISVVGFYRIGENTRPRHHIFSRSLASNSCDPLSQYLEENSCLVDGMTVRKLKIKSGYWRESTAVDRILRCPNGEFCSKTGSKFLSGPNSQCSEFHHGVYCNHCVEGYALSSNGCQKCSSEEIEHQTVRLAIFVVLICLLFLFGLLFIVSPVCICKSNFSFLQKLALKTEKEQKTEAKSTSWARLIWILAFRSIETKTRIILGFLQVWFALERFFIVGAETGNLDIFEMISGLDPARLASLLDIRCSFDHGHYETLFIYTFMPLLFAVCANGFDIHFSRRYPRYQKHIHKRAVKILFYLSFLVYPGVSRAILETFICESFPEADGNEIFSSALQVDYRISCEASQQRMVALTYAVVMLIYYPIGILVVYSYLMMLYQEKAEEGREYHHNLKLLVRPYKKEAYWFETYELVRKLSQTCLIAFAYGAGFDELPALVSLILAIVAAFILIYVKPYRNYGDFWFALLSLVLIITGSISGLISVSQQIRLTLRNAVIIVECISMPTIILLESLRTYLLLKSATKDEANNVTTETGIGEENNQPESTNKRQEEKSRLEESSKSTELTLTDEVVKVDIHDGAETKASTNKDVLVFDRSKCSNPEMFELLETLQESFRCHSSPKNKDISNEFHTAPERELLNDKRVSGIGIISHEIPHSTDTREMNVNELSLTDETVGTIRKETETMQHHDEIPMGITKNACSTRRHRVILSVFVSFNIAIIVAFIVIVFIPTRQTPTQSCTGPYTNLKTLTELPCEVVSQVHCSELQECYINISGNISYPLTDQTNIEYKSCQSELIEYFGISSYQGITDIARAMHHLSFAKRVCSLPVGSLSIQLPGMREQLSEIDLKVNKQTDISDLEGRTFKVEKVDIKTSVLPHYHIKTILTGQYLNVADGVVGLFNSKSNSLSLEFKNNRTGISIFGFYRANRNTTQVYIKDFYSDMFLCVEDKGSTENGVTLGLREKGRLSKDLCGFLLHAKYRGYLPQFVEEDVMLSTVNIAPPLKANHSMLKSNNVTATQKEISSNYSCRGTCPTPGIAFGHCLRSEAHDPKNKFQLAVTTSRGCPLQNQSKVECLRYQGSGPWRGHSFDNSKPNTGDYEYHPDLCPQECKELCFNQTHWKGKTCSGLEFPIGELGCEIHFGLFSHLGTSVKTTLAVYTVPTQCQV